MFGYYVIVYVCMGHLVISLSTMCNCAWGQFRKAWRHTPAKSLGDIPPGCVFQLISSN